MRIVLGTLAACVVVGSAAAGTAPVARNLVATAPVKAQLRATLRARIPAEQRSKVRGPMPRRWPLPLAAVAYARRGDFAASRRLLSLLDDPRVHAVYRVRELEARSVLIVEEGTWDEAASVVEAARRHAEEARAIGLAFHADRLEGHLLRERGDAAAARMSFSRALEGFASLNARWEVAQTQLALAETLLDLGSPDEARPLLAEAEETFARLRVPRELARARALRERA